MFVSRFHQLTVVDAADEATIRLAVVTSGNINHTQMSSNSCQSSSQLCFSSVSCQT